MSKHLPLLREMFPGEVMLGVEQIARCLKFSKGHIYNLSSAKKLPFRVHESSGRLMVSIIELADYLDRSLLSASPANDEHVHAPPIKRRPGRPRGSTTKRRQELSKVAFQASLRAEVLAFEAQELLTNLRSIVNAEFDAADVGEHPLSVMRPSLIACIGSSLVHYRNVCQATSLSEPAVRGIDSARLRLGGEGILQDKD